VTAVEVVAELEALGSPASLADLRKRLAPDEAAIGMRMRDLFAVAKAHTLAASSDPPRRPHGHGEAPTRDPNPLRRPLTTNVEMPFAGLVVARRGG